jgi:hypothetical protein
VINHSSASEEKKKKREHEEQEELKKPSLQVAACCVILSFQLWPKFRQKDRELACQILIRLRKTKEKTESFYSILDLLHFVSRAEAKEKPAFKAKLLLHDDHLRSTCGQCKRAIKAEVTGK